MERIEEIERLPSTHATESLLSGCGRIAGMTDRQRRFIAEKAAGKSGTQAAKDAGYAPSSAAITASQLLRDPKIASAVAEMETSIAERAAERAVVSKEMVLRELALHAFATLDDVAPWDEEGPHLIPSADLPRDKRALVASIKVKRERQYRGHGPEAAAWDVEHVEIKPWDKLKALEMLGRHLKMWSDVPEVVQDNRVQIAVGSLTDEQLAAILAVRGQM